MMIPCNYQINVTTQPEENARYGRHYCRIELGDCTKEVALEKFKKLNEKLDEFRLTLTEVHCDSREIAGYCWWASNGEEWRD